MDIIDTLMLSDETLYLPRPVYPPNYAFIDEDCKAIAELLRDEINETFYDALRNNMVKSIRTFNDVYVPLGEFPVLKVYKENEKSGLNQPQISTTFKIVYALAFTNKNRVADVSSFVGKEIRRILTNASLNQFLQIDWGDSGEDTIDIEYEDFISPDNTIYKYVTVTVPIFTLDAVLPA